eukprot:15366300-Ditylum_brightwellii.AAC.1
MNLQILSSCAFVDLWSNSEITPSTYCLYEKKYPAKEAPSHFVELIDHRTGIGALREHQRDDAEKSMYSHCDWMTTSESTINALDQKN